MVVAIKFSSLDGFEKGSLRVSNFLGRLAWQGLGYVRKSDSCHVVV